MIFFDYFQITLYQSLTLSLFSTQIKMDHNCIICLSELGNRNITTLDCGHSFHYGCIFRWNTQHNSCPYCRNPILPNQNNENNNENEENNMANDDEIYIHDIEIIDNNEGNEEDIIENINHIIDNIPDYNIIDIGGHDGDQFGCIGNSDKLKKLGWSPKTNLNIGIYKFLTYIKEQYEK